jgi:FecR protein.
MTAVDRLKQLLFLPKDQRESPEVVESIRQLLNEDQKAVEFYVRWSYFESSLQWHLTSVENRNVVVSQVQSEFQKRRIARLIALLCCSVLCVLLGFQATLIAIRSSVKAVKFSPIAGWIEVIDGVVWEGSHLGLQPLIRPGQRFCSRQGQFQIHLDSGAKIACSGKVDLEILNTMQIRVNEGSLCVNVPERAHGFEVITKSCQLVDLGTLFGLKVSVDGTTELHVFQGKVDARNELIPGFLAIPGVALRATSNQAHFHQIPSDDSLFASQLNSIAGIRETRNQVLLLSRPPESVRFADSPSRDSAVLFKERTVIIPDKLQVDLALPGRYSQDQLPKQGMIAAGTVLTSYLLHGQTLQSSPLEGQVTFDGTILGIAMSPESLQETDPVFGLPQVLYPDNLEDSMAMKRGALHREGTDRIEISEDRRTLKFRLQCTTSSLNYDQIRIFVSQHAGEQVEMSSGVTEN